jgi:hydroxymethylglutaryl-CoA lyase
MNPQNLLSAMPQAVSLMEVGPRDGLQNEKQFVATEEKIRLIESLVDAGIKRIEITSFVSPRMIMALADHAEVAAGIARKPGVSYAALVANMKGYERAHEALVDEVGLVVAVTDSHNQKNINATIKEALARYQEIAGRCLTDKRRFRAYISCSFGCPYEGLVAPEKVAELAKQLTDMGAYQISLGDTIGVATPKSTVAVIDAVQKKVPATMIALHMHDTYGRALANITVALAMGISAFDSSVGGLGGCPYAPGAAGNVATEDLVSMLEGMGIESGVSVESLCRISLQMEKILGKNSPSKVVATCR